MPLSAHEAFELNELLLSCTNSIQCMALYIHQAQDPELREMIQRHYSVHVQDYNMKVEYARQIISRDQLNVPSMPTGMDIPGPMNNYPPIQPEVRLDQLDNRSIASSYLLTLKRAGREYAWSAFECSTPQLRLFLEDAFRMCSHQAYEVWLYMARKGWYPISMASPQTLSAMGQIYQEVPYQQPVSLYR
jgi:spore coat protein CotF